MQSRTWGIIAVIALVLAGVVLAVVFIGRGRPEASVSATSTPTPTSELEVEPSPSPVASPTPVRSVTYTVQSGDTLSAIAQEHEVSIEALTAANSLPDPDVLQVGQVLIIPEEGDPASPALAPDENSESDGSEESGEVLVAPTLTPGGPSLVEITGATGIGDLEAETITLSNQGGMVNLESWTLSSADEERFVFPALTLFTEGEVRVHSGAGEDTPRDLYWDRAESAWRQGQLVTLRDADGNVVDTYILPD